jgi:hypothetical protein
MSQIAASVCDTDIMASVIVPEEPGIDIEAARWFMTLKFSDVQKARMEELAEKNNEGSISDGELAELESYLRVGNLLNFLKAKARVSLATVER